MNCLSDFDYLCEYLTAHLSMPYIYRPSLLLVFREKLSIVQHTDDGLGYDNPAIHLNNDPYGLSVSLFFRNKTYTESQDLLKRLIIDSGLGQYWIE